MSTAGSGRFITLEGGEGAGKSTQISTLLAHLQAVGIQAVMTREPGGSPGAEAIRQLLVSGDTGRWDGMTEALLHFAARRDHLVRTVWPALAAGRWVICDRFADSTLAYQGYAQGLRKDLIDRLYHLVVGEFTPDLTLVLDLPVAAGLARARQRAGGEDRYERMGPEFHEKLRAGFHDIVANSAGRCVLVDAGGTAEQVAARIWTLVAERFTLPA